MRKNAYILAALMVLPMAIGCQKTESPAVGVEPAVVETPADETGFSPIIFHADTFDASVQTKAAPTEVTSLSAFNVTAVTGTAGSETAVSGVSNTAFSGTSSYTGGVYWPATNGSWSFYASTEAITFAAAGCTIAVPDITKDIVCCRLPYGTTANTTAVYKTSNKLSFEHIFAQIGQCKITAPSGYTVSNLTVKVTPKVPASTTTYNLRTKAFSTSQDGSEVTLCTAVGSTTDNNLWLLPGDYVLTASYTLTKGAYTKSFTKTATVSIAQGKNSNISATLPTPTGDDAAAEITFTVSVTAWSNASVTATFS